ncbi:lipoyl protein ligase domain-containing protein [Streptomyces sp. NPDC088727]|uniref:lipoyl protein ligase domain-containing protein n=1 Tax=Streptomyces sp. NPDC088727 TaxID=3365875 RepID=UPI0038298F61
MGIERIDLGEEPYEVAQKNMVRWVAERKQERAGNRLFLLTHPPVITYTGRTPADQLPPTTSPISLVEVDRGGHATYHGPGQLIGGLPAPANDPTVRTEGARVRIELDFATRPQFSAAFKLLSGRFSLSQLVCTAAGARQAEDPGIGTVSVTVTASVGGAEPLWSADGNSGTRCSHAGRIPGAASRPG